MNTELTTVECTKEVYSRHLKKFGNIDTLTDPVSYIDAKGVLKGRVTDQHDPEKVKYVVFLTKKELAER